MRSIRPIPNPIRNRTNRRPGTNRTNRLVHTQSKSSYSDLLHMIDSGDVEFASLSQNQRKIVVETRSDGTQEIILPDRNNVIDVLMEHDVPVSIEPVQAPAFSPVEAIAIFIQVVIFGVIVRMIFSQNQSSNNGMFSFGQSKANEIESKDINVTFADVAGIENAKRDLKEVVDFLKNPEKYASVGAKVPKGVLLIGPPGTGKTLLAKAVAGEAQVPFYACSGSDFIEMFVGVGASRIRDLFQKAIKKAPCIIFIDEIDAIGKARSVGIGAGQNDERDQTINQLLTAMDGFKESSGVIVLAATNRPELLDSALLRPGRFDRKVMVELSDFKGRLQILRVHTAKKPLADGDADLEYVAKNTVGFSGADLENLANEAAILTARKDKKLITRSEWDSALEKVILGDERLTMMLSDKKRRVLAYHEAGHTLMSLLFSDFDNLRKVTIIPRGSAGGVTYFEPNEERIDMNLVTRDYLENQIMVALGGRIAEELVFGTMRATTGASGDLQVVSEIAYGMVASYGFNETLGPIAWDHANVDVSGDIAAEMKFIVEHLYNKAHQHMRDNEFYLHRIAEALLEKETLDGDDVRKLTEGITVRIYDTMDNTSSISDNNDLFMK